MCRITVAVPILLTVDLTAQLSLYILDQLAEHIAIFL